MEKTIAGGIVIVFDPSDREHIEKHRWFGLKRHGEIQVRTTIFQQGRRQTVLLARLLTGASKGQQVVHLNGNRLDFRRENLRVVSPSTTGARRKAKNKYRGVTYVKKKGMYVARMRHDKVNHFLGYHPTEEEAALAVDLKAIELLGELARLNLQSSRKFLSKGEP